jgi:hypothetical protein
MLRELVQEQGLVPARGWVSIPALERESALEKVQVVASHHPSAGDRHFLSFLLLVAGYLVRKGPRRLRHLLRRKQVKTPSRQPAATSQPYELLFILRIVRM